MTYRAIAIAVLASCVLVSCDACGSHGSSTSGVMPIRNPTFGFVVVGDFGSGDEIEQAVAADVEGWAERHPINALVTTGDNVYPEDESSIDDAWTRPSGWVAQLGLPVVATLGNHDVEDNGGAQIIELLEMPGPYYEVDLSDADIFVLDSNRLDDASQLEWLDAALAATERAWQIVVFHHPAFSCSQHGSTPEVIEQWVPILERHGVDLVLNGHDHNYQRFAPLNGVTYLVTGGGGAELYEVIVRGTSRSAWLPTMIIITL